MHKAWYWLKGLKRHESLPLAIICIVIIGFACYCIVVSRSSPEDKVESGILVNILLTKMPPGETLPFSVNGPYKVFGGSEPKPFSSSGHLLFGYRLGRAEAVYEAGTGLTLNGESIPFREMVVIPEHDGILRAGNRRYGGAFRLEVREDGTVLLFNTIDLEHYLAGVLYEEMPSSFPDEALKAQAVAARSYALFRMASGSRYLTDDTRSQVYGGISAETARSLKIVRETRGEVLMFEKAVLPTYYSSTCGGITARVSDLFQGRAPAPIDRNRACGFCSDSPFYAWRALFTREQVLHGLHCSGVPSSFEVGVTASDTARRATEISLLDGHGGILQRFPANTFRSRMNQGRPLRRRILSTLLDSITLKEGVFIFQGRGWGHGVGLCQYGARGLAEQGRTYQEILQFYYEGAELLPDYGGLFEPQG